MPSPLPTIVACASILTFAVGGDAAAQATPTPEIFFRSPANGATVSATFPVVFGLRNYGVAPAGINVKGTGHFHVLIDTEAPPVGTIIPTDSLNRHFGTAVIETRLTLSPGPHTLRLVLGDFEHKVIGRDLVSAPIRVTVRPAASSLRPEQTDRSAPSAERPR